MHQHSLQVISLSLTRPQRPHAPNGRCPMNCSQSPSPFAVISSGNRKLKMQLMTSGHLILLFCAIFASFQVTLCVQGHRIDYSRTCEPIKIEMCRNNGYNVTAMPNFVGNELQSEAEIQLSSFLPLIQYGCSSQLKFFLCSVYTPICSEKIPINIGPCRPMCQTVRDRCQPVLKEFGFQWPPALNCDNFPVANNAENMCIEGPGESESLPPPVSSSPPSLIDDNDEYDPHHELTHDLSVNRKKIPNRPSSQGGDDLLRNGRRGHKVNPECVNLKQSHEYFYVNRTATCVQKCDSDVLFSKENKAFAQNWLMFWSISCLVTTLLAIVVFVRDSNRFRYPERMIIIMAISSFLSCLGYLLRVIFGRESVSCYLESQHQTQLLIQEGPDNVYCTIVFVLLFYFGSATFIWWVNLTIAWYLSSSLNWSSETIERKSSYFHCVAWLIPALQTLVILIIRAVDSDELTGICFVGNHSSETLLAFILIPGLLYILIGFTFLLTRVYNLYYCGKSEEQCTSLGIRQGSHHSCSSSHAHLSQMTLSSYCSPGGKDSDSLLNMCIGFIAFSYLILYSILLCGYGYEYLYRDLWYQSGSREIPNMEFFTIKIFLSLVIGIIAGSWIWCSTNPTIFWSGTCSTFSKKHPMSPYLLPQVVSASTYSVGGPLATGVTNVALASVPPFNSFTGSGSIAASTLLPPHSYASLRPASNIQKTILVKPSTLDKRTTRGKGGETTV